MIGFRFYAASAPALQFAHGRPPSAGATMPACDGVHRPSFDYRCVDSRSSAGVHAVGWAVQNHQNGGGDRTGNFVPQIIPPQMGGAVMFSNDTTTSTVFALVPPLDGRGGDGAIYVGQYDAHPEYYSLLPPTPNRSSDGNECIDAPSSCVRSHNSSVQGAPFAGARPTKLCWAGGHVQSALIASAQRKLRYEASQVGPARGGVQMIGLAENDVDDEVSCHCEKCVAMREAERTFPACDRTPGGCGETRTPTKYLGDSGSHVRVANELKAALAHEFPSVKVQVQAYHTTLQPPRLARPDAGVVVQFTTLHSNFGWPITHTSNNLTYGQLVGWSAIVPRGQLYVWDFSCQQNHPMVLLPNWWKLAEDAKTFHALGVAGVFAEADPTFVTPDLQELRAWVLQSLLWDVRRDADALIDEFLAGYYSPAAAPHVLDHMRAYREEVEATNATVRLNDFFDAPYFAPRVLLRSLTSLDAAVGVVNGSTAEGAHVVGRLMRLRVSPWFGLLTRWEEGCNHTIATKGRWPLAATLGESLDGPHGWVATAMKNVGASGVNTLAGSLTVLRKQANVTCAAAWRTE